MPSTQWRVRIGSCLQEFFENRGVSDVDGFRHRRRAEFVLRIDVGAGANQPIHHVGVGVMDGPVKRRCAIGGRAVHVHLLVDELDRGGRIPGLNGIDQICRPRGQCGAAGNRENKSDAIELCRILDLRERLRAVVADFAAFRLPLSERRSAEGSKAVSDRDTSDAVRP